MVHGEIPPIKDFVMRCVTEKLDKVSEIAGFLGIDEATVQVTFDQLFSEKRLMFDEDSATVELTERGRDALSKAQESWPQDAPARCR